jgi:hypothetical protein
MINAILRLRRDNDYNYAKIKDTFIPANGEICLVDTARHGLRAVCGDGVSTFGQLEYIGESFIQAYYDNNTKNFYSDKTLTKEITKKENIIYLDIDTTYLYFWTGEAYKRMEAYFPLATESEFGMVKLYNDIGDNTDGTMTQKSISKELKELDDELDTKFEISIKENDELIIFS